MYIYKALVFLLLHDDMRVVSVVSKVMCALLEREDIGKKCLQDPHLFESLLILLRYMSTQHLSAFVSIRQHMSACVKSPS
jgi:hypothetical protein